MKKILPFPSYLQYITHRKAGSPTVLAAQRFFKYVQNAVGVSLEPATHVTSHWKETTQGFFKVEMKWYHHVEPVMTLKFTKKIGGIHLDWLSIEAAFRKHQSRYDLFPKCVSFLKDMVNVCDPKVTKITLLASGRSTELKWGSLAWTRYAHFSSDQECDALRHSFKFFIQTSLKEHETLKQADRTPILSDAIQKASTWKTPQDIASTTLFYKGQELTSTIETQSGKSITLPLAKAFLLAFDWDGYLSLDQEQGVKKA